ncbi:MAG: hypothetical protein UFN18_01600 [Ruminococcus sp.]|nr:hypothetical protein [Ruminococcus sp.]
MADSEREYTHVDFLKDDNGDFYYCDELGNRLKGVNKVNGFYYLFGTVDGVLKVEWQTPNDKRYYYSPKDGNPVFGFIKYHGKFYYVDYDKGKIVNEMITIDGLDYTFDENGVLTSDVNVDVKDKLITLESIGVLHLYAENNYLKAADCVGKYWIDSDGNKQGEIHGDLEGNQATKECSFAGGFNCLATDICTFAIGNYATASGNTSASIGQNTEATGDYSFATNYFTKASGLASFSEGYQTIASGDYSHVQGKYNIEDTDNKYAFIIGNGTSDTTRSNAFAIDWNGGLYIGNEKAKVSLTLGERVQLYVDVESGSDTNNGKTIATAVQTIDRALALANAYQEAIICLKRGQTYTATDKSNEYGTGIQLYHKTLRFEAYGTASNKPKIQNAIFTYNCNFEWKDIDLTGNNSVFTMYNTISSFEGCAFYWVESHNSFAQVRLCDIQREWVQYGGFSVISNAESLYHHIGGIQVNQGARVDYSGFGIGSYGNDGCSVLTIDAIPEKLQKTKNIAEGSIETKTVYVNAATGSDARDGTSQAKALLTMSRALQFTQYAKKAVIYLAAGTYPIPNKTLTLLGRDVRIYGNAAATTTIQGNFVCENGFLHLSKVTIDNTDSDTANTSTTAILAQYNGTVRISDCVVNANSKNAVGVSDMSNICCSGTEFKGNAQYAVYVTGQGDAKIYSCTNSTTKSIYSGANSMVRITQSNESDFPYTNANNGMVFVNGQQVLPKKTAVTSDQATSSD